MQNLANAATPMPATPLCAESAETEYLDNLTDDLKRLLVRHSSVLKEEGVRRQMQALETWVATQRNGPAPACVISESGITWLTQLHDQLKLSADEMLRLEGEGGNPASTEQAEKVEELLRTIRHIQKIIDNNPTAKAM